MLPRNEDQKPIHDEKIMNFAIATDLALKAIRQYKTGLSNGEIGDRYGQYHGERGQNRARHLEGYLTMLQKNSDCSGSVENFQANLLSLFLAIFYIKPDNTGFFSLFSKPFKNIGRSSKLASLIADQWIEGNIQFGAVLDNNNLGLTSSVFTLGPLREAQGVEENFRYIPSSQASFSYLDKTKAVRQLLNKALDSDLFKSSKNKILQAIPKLCDYLERNEDSFWRPTMLSLPFYSAESVILESTLTAALSSDSADLPSYVSTFLTSSDAAHFIVNKASAKAFKEAMSRVEKDLLEEKKKLRLT